MVGAPAMRNSASARRALAAAAGRSGAWTITTDAHDPARLQHIYQRINATAASAWGDGIAVLEDLPSHAQSAGLTGMAQGVIRLALLNCGVPFVTVPPATLKKYATGKGNATKADMRMAWYQRAGDDVRDDNQVDALWLRQIGLAILGDPAAITMPQVNRTALMKVKLPSGVSHA